MWMHIIFTFLFVTCTTSFQPLPSTSWRPTATSLIKVASSSNNKDDNDNTSASDFMESLRSRIDEVSSKETILPLVVLDSMLPRQVLKISAKNPLLAQLVRTLVSQERPQFGMLGLAKLVTGETVHLRTGVEVDIVNRPSVQDDGGLQLELKAGRRFRILGGDVQTADGGWTEARVEFLKEDEDANEDADMLAIRKQAKELAELVPAWVELARQNERQDGQIDNLLQDLGEYPSSPSEQAFWVGALINPIPAMGVALEIRPQLLTVKTAKERVDCALEGIRRSIAHMDGSKQLF